MLTRISLWVIAAVDLGVLIYYVIREWRLHPDFLQERWDHQIFVIGGAALLVAQIGAIGLALTSSRSGASILQRAGAAVVVAGAALFNAASLFVVANQFWILGTDGWMSMSPLELAIFIVWAVANVVGFVATLRRRPWAATPFLGPDRSA